MNHEYQSVWDAIEENPVKSANLKLRSALMMAIGEYFKATGLAESEAAKKLGTTHGRLNDVLKGRIEKCRVSSLVDMLVSVDLKVDMGLSRVD